MWKYPKVWEGFIKCCQRTRPQSFQVVLQLPPPQLAAIFEKCPELREPLLSHVRALTPHQVTPPAATQTPRSPFLRGGPKRPLCSCPLPPASPHPALHHGHSGSFRPPRAGCPRRGEGGAQGGPGGVVVPTMSPRHVFLLAPPQEKPVKRPSEEEAKGKAPAAAGGGGGGAAAPPSETPPDLGAVDLEPPPIFISVAEDEESSGGGGSPPDSALEANTAATKVSDAPPSTLRPPQNPV